MQLLKRLPDAGDKCQGTPQFTSQKVYFNTAAVCSKHVGIG